MSSCNNCETCSHCWRDDSVGDRECLCESLTEEEIETYYVNMKGGCPHYKSCSEAMNEFWEIAKNYYHP